MAEDKPPPKKPKIHIIQTDRADGRWVKSRLKPDGTVGPPQIKLEDLPAPGREFKLWFPCCIVGCPDDYPTHMGRVLQNTEMVHAQLQQMLGEPIYSNLGWAIILVGIQGVMNTCTQLGTMTLEDMRAFEASIHDVIEKGFLALSNPPRTPVS